MLLESKGIWKRTNNTSFARQGKRFWCFYHAAVTAPVTAAAAAVTAPVTAAAAAAVTASIYLQERARPGHTAGRFG